MKLSEALIAKANLMLDDDYVMDRFAAPPTQEQVLEEVVRSVGGVIRRLEPGQSITVERRDDQDTPWMLTWTNTAAEEDGPLGPGNQDDYLTDGDYR